MKKLNPQGEIWLADLGDELNGHEMRKTRPVVILNSSNGFLDLCIIAPLTGWKDSFNAMSWMVYIEPSESNGLTQIDAIDMFQIKSISEGRLVKRLGTLSREKVLECRSILFDLTDVVPKRIWREGNSEFNRVKNR